MHNMKLNNEYFEYIKNGTKKYEIRLNDEKRQKIHINDEVVFTNISTHETIAYKVLDLIYFDNFNDLLNNIDIKFLSDVSVSKETLLESLNTFYSKEDQNKYEIVAIKIKE